MTTYFRYSEPVHVNGFTTVRAKVPVFFLSSEGSWIPHDFIVDTGADVSVMGKSFASRLAYFTVPRAYSLGQVKGHFVGQYTVFKAKIMDKIFYLPTVVVEDENYVLGRAGFLDHFRIHFEPYGFKVEPIYY